MLVEIIVDVFMFKSQVYKYETMCDQMNYECM